MQQINSSRNRSTTAKNFRNYLNGWSVKGPLKLPSPNAAATNRTHAGLNTWLLCTQEFAGCGQQGMEQKAPIPKRQRGFNFSAFLLLHLMLGVRLSQSIVSSQFYRSAFCLVSTRKGCLLSQSPQ